MPAVENSSADPGFPQRRFVDPKPVAGLDFETREVLRYVTLDGRMVYFESNRADPNAIGTSGFDLWTASRASADQPFGEPVMMPAPFSNEDEDCCIYLSSDGLMVNWGISDIHVDGDVFENDRIAFRTAVEDEWGPDLPITDVFDLEAWRHDVTRFSNVQLSTDLKAMYFTVELSGTDDLDLYGAYRDSLDAPFGPPIPLLPGDTSRFVQRISNVSSNELAIFYQSNETVDNFFTTLWVATRSSPREQFGTPVRLDDLSLRSALDVNGVAEFVPRISLDWPRHGSKLYYTRATSVTENWDPWEATWELELVGDFNFDGQLDANDIDLLSGNAASIDLLYDLNYDDQVDLGDIDTLRVLAAHENGFAEPYLVGDANLDGTVNVTDLNAIAVSWRKSGDWTDGDFTADGVVDSQDLNALALNWQESIPMATPKVPEPHSSLPFSMFFGLMLLAWRPLVFHRA